MSDGGPAPEPAGQAAPASEPTGEGPAPAARHDIDTRADVERLVRAFYGRALTDMQIGFLFTDVAKLDLEAHVPEITSFWETILLGAQSYRGGAFRPHAALNTKVRLRAGHFERWLVLWRTSVDELFDGPRAELAKSHALRVARAFHGRLEALPSDSDPPGTGPGAESAATPGGLVVSHHGSSVGGGEPAVGGLPVTQHRPAD